MANGITFVQHEIKVTAKESAEDLMEYQKNQ